MLIVNNIEVVFDNFYLVLKGISLEVKERGVVAFLGSNGAGKSTVLKAITGLLKSERGIITSGSIKFNGHRIENRPPRIAVNMGITMIPEGGEVFDLLSVEENILIGRRRGKRKEIKEDAERSFHFFPNLIKHRKKLAGFMSGGEQQMIAIGRALMAKPKIMLLDEPSLGLAPLLVNNIFEIIGKIVKERNVAILLVEQNATIAFSFAEYGYIIENGKIVIDGRCNDLKMNEDVREFYLGIGDKGEKRKFHDVKHYKRRKRWLS